MPSPMRGRRNSHRFDRLVLLEARVRSVEHGGRDRGVRGSRVVVQARNDGSAVSRGRRVRKESTPETVDGVGDVTSGFAGGRRRENGAHVLEAGAASERYERERVEREEKNREIDRPPGEQAEHACILLSPREPGEIRAKAY